MNQQKKVLLQRLLVSRCVSEEDTITIAGREVTVSQESFIRADISAARSILDRLRSTENEGRGSCYTTQVIKVIGS